MDLMEIAKIEEGQVYGVVEREIEEKCPDEVKLIDESPQDVWAATWLLIPHAVEKAFEMGFEMGQRIAGKEKPVPVRWSGEL